MKARLLSAIALVTQLVTISFAQQPVASPPPFPSQKSQTQKSEDVDVVRITTNLVQVDAVVTDKSGKSVTDLKPEEVQLFEDGRQQKITHFTYNIAETAPAEGATKPFGIDKGAPPTRLRREDVRRTIAIVVDDL